MRSLTILAAVVLATLAATFTGALAQGWDSQNQLTGGYFATGRMLMAASSDTTVAFPKKTILGNDAAALMPMIRNPGAAGKSDSVQSVSWVSYELVSTAPCSMTVWSPACPGGSQMIYHEGAAGASTGGFLPFAVDSLGVHAAGTGQTFCNFWGLI